MLLRDNPSLPPTAGRFVLQDAPVPKRNGCNAPYGQDRVVNLVGQFVPTREPSFLDSSGKDNPPPQNPRTENSLSVSLHLPPVLHPFRRTGVRVPPASKSYFLLAPIGPARQFTARETVVLRLSKDPHGAGMPQTWEAKTAREPACWKPAAHGGSAFP